MTDSVITLDPADCYVLLRGRTLGRVAVKIAEDLVILPVYYAVMDDDIVFRTAPGTKLNAAVLKTKVAFEVDGASPGWSVLVRGHAEGAARPREPGEGPHVPRKRLAGGRAGSARAHPRRAGDRPQAATSHLTALAAERPQRLTVTVRPCASWSRWAWVNFELPCSPNHV